MAYLQCFLMEEKELQRDVLSSLRAVEDLRIAENNAAIKIQSWFRSHQIQSFLKFLNACAVLIQKTYKGYVYRRLYREKVQNKLKNIQQMYFDAVATKIQSRWRGFYVRKYKFDFYSRKRYLNALLIKNHTIRQQLEKVKLEKEIELENQLADQELADTLYENRKTHYLLSTRVSRGIYNSPTKPCSKKENALRQSIPLSQVERDKIRISKELSLLETATGIPNSEELLVDVTYSPLPPINTKKLQGPFRHPLDVQEQRYKTLQPTLRVATQFKSVESERTVLRQEEWTKRINDKSFLPATKRNEKYIPALHSTSSFGRIKYGSKHFREISPVKQIHPKDFQRVVSPIPVFDQLGKTY